MRRFNRAEASCVDNHETRLHPGRRAPASVTIRLSILPDLATGTLPGEYFWLSLGDRSDSLGEKPRTYRCRHYRRRDSSQALD